MAGLNSINGGSIASHYAPPPAVASATQVTGLPESLRLLSAGLATQTHTLLASAARPPAIKRTGVQSKPHVQQLQDGQWELTKLDFRHGRNRQTLLKFLQIGQRDSQFLQNNPESARNRRYTASSKDPGEKFAPAVRFTNCNFTGVKWREVIDDAKARGMNIAGINSFRIDETCKTDGMSFRDVRVNESLIIFGNPPESAQPAGVSRHSQPGRVDLKGAHFENTSLIWLSDKMKFEASGQTRLSGTEFYFSPDSDHTYRGLFRKGTKIEYQNIDGAPIKLTGNTIPALLNGSVITLGYVDESH